MFIMYCRLFGNNKKGLKYYLNNNFGIYSSLKSFFSVWKIFGRKSLLEFAFTVWIKQRWEPMYGVKVFSSHTLIFLIGILLNLQKEIFCCRATGFHHCLKNSHTRFKTCQKLSLFVPHKIEGRYMKNERKTFPCTSIKRSLIN